MKRDISSFEANLKGRSKLFVVILFRWRKVGLCFCFVDKQYVNMTKAMPSFCSLEMEIERMEPMILLRHLLRCKLSKRKPLQRDIFSCFPSHSQDIGRFGKLHCRNMELQQIKKARKTWKIQRSKQESSILTLPEDVRECSTETQLCFVLGISANQKET